MSGNECGWRTWGDRMSDDTLASFKVMHSALRVSGDKNMFSVRHAADLGRMAAHLPEHDREKAIEEMATSVGLLGKRDRPAISTFLESITAELNAIRAEAAAAALVERLAGKVHLA
jgi:hypothetical protein